MLLTWKFNYQLVSLKLVSLKLVSLKHIKILNIHTLVKLMMLI